MNNLKNLKNRLEGYLEPIVREEGFELISLTISQDRVQLTINRVGGVTLDECASINRKLSNFLEEEDSFEVSYTLEVSSPGVDKVIESEKEYRCLIDKELSIKIEGGVLIEGILRSVKDGVLIIGLEDKDISLNITDIREAKQKIKLSEV